MGGLESRALAQRLAGRRTSRVRLGPLAAALLTIALTCCLFGPMARANAAPLHGPGQALQTLLLSQRAELTPADGAAGDMFGCSVALSGDTALVGAYGHAAAGKACVGAAYVFVRSGTSWTQQAELTDPDAAANDQFGRSVALSGDTALVAAPGKTAGGLWVGAAYVYVRSGTTWVRQTELTPAGSATGSFGASVALDGDTALVGYGGQDESFAGEVSVFVRSGTTWTRQAEWMGLSSESGFGDSLALSGDMALVAAPGMGFPFAGSAYVFMRSGTTWTQQAELTGAGGGALSGDTALVGTDVFVRSGTTWSQQTELSASDGEPGNCLGSPVALFGDTALAAAPRAGSAYVFMRSGTTWTQQAELMGPASDTAFGNSLALSGDTALVATPGQDVAYAFVVAPDLIAPTTTVSGDALRLEQEASYSDALGQRQLARLRRRLYPVPPPGRVALDDLLGPLRSHCPGTLDLQVPLPRRGRQCRAGQDLHGEGRHAPADDLGALRDSRRARQHGDPEVRRPGCLTERRHGGGDDQGEDAPGQGGQDAQARRQAGEQAPLDQVPLHACQAHLQVLRLRQGHGRQRAIEVGEQQANRTVRRGLRRGGVTSPQAVGRRLCRWLPLRRAASGRMFTFRRSS